MPQSRFKGFIDILTLLMLIVFLGSTVMLIIFIAMKRRPESSITGICVGVSAGYLVLIALVAQVCYRQVGSGFSLFLWSRFVSVVL